LFVLVAALSAATWFVAQTAGASTPVVDQSQPVIDVNAVTFMGGTLHTSDAQIVTAGLTGPLTEVRLPIYCDGAGATLVVRIEGVGPDGPDGNVLASQTFDGSTLPFYSTWPTSVPLRSFAFSDPPLIQAGTQFAIVLDNTGPEASSDCAIFVAGLTNVNFYPGGGYCYRDDTFIPYGYHWGCFADDFPFATVVEVTDTTPPVLTVADVVADATGPTGAAVSYSVSATDDVDGPVTPTCVPTSSSMFSIGDTTVNCTATDAAGNTGTASFNVHVRGAADQVTNLVGTIDGYGLGKLGTSLDDKLATVSRGLAANKTQQACSSLSDFLSQVRSQSGKGLTAGQAAYLTGSANQIATVIGC
jgi:hypothetical protein